MNRSADAERNWRPLLQRHTADGVKSARDVAAVINQGEDSYEQADRRHEQEQNAVA